MYSLTHQHLTRYLCLLSSRSEAGRITMSNNIRALILGPFLASIKLVIFLTFVVYVYMGGAMTAEKVFITISLYQAVRLSTTLFIPFAFQFLSESRVTVQRLQVSECYSNHWFSFRFTGTPGAAEVVFQCETHFQLVSKTAVK